MYQQANYYRSLPAKSKELYKSYFDGFRRIYATTCAIVLAYCITRFAIILKETISYDSCHGYGSLHIAPLITYGAWIFLLSVFCLGLLGRSFMIVKLFEMLFYGLLLLEIACIVTYLYFGGNLYGDCFVREHLYSFPRILSAAVEAGFAIIMAMQCRRGVKYMEKAELV